MKASSFLRRSIVAACVVVIVSVSAFGDTIRLKDGGLIKGRIVSFSGGRFIIEVSQGSRQRQMVFFADEVESIEFDSVQGYADGTRNNSAPLYNNRSQNTTGGNSPGTQTRRQDTTDGVMTVGARIIRPGSTPSTPPATGRSTSPQTSQPTYKAPPTPQQQEPVAEEIEDKDDVVAEQPVITPKPAPRAPALTKPVELSVKVLADNTANGWTNSGWVVQKGQKIRISADGTVSLGGGRSSTPEGKPEINDDQKLLKAVATGALIAVVGDDNNDFMYIGAEREFTAQRDGALFLGVNEGNLNDNSGSFQVKIQISPAEN